MSARTAAALAAAVVVATLGTVRAETAVDGADVEALTLRFRPRGDVCRLRLRVPLDPYLDTLDVQNSVVAVHLDDVPALELATPEARRRLRAPRPLVWRYRAPAHGPRMRLDLAHHRLRLDLTRASLDALSSASVGGVDVTLQLGDHVYTAHAQLERSRGRLRLVTPTPGGGGGGDGGGGSGGGGGSVPFAAFDSGGYSGVTTARTVVCRTDAEFAALWSQHVGTVSPAPPRPAVDFTRDMVVAVFLGHRPSPAHSVALERVTRTDADLTVRYVDARVTSGTCVFPAVVVQPYVMATVPQSAGAVTFTGRIDERTCP